MEDYQKELLKLLKAVVLPATGCTEPVAVAYAVTKARELCPGILKYIRISVDSNIYKNGLGVTIPRTKEKGLIIAAALGYISGSSEKRFQVIDNILDTDLEKARNMIHNNQINLSINTQAKELYIEVCLTTDKGKARIIAQKEHLNIVRVEKVELNEEFSPFTLSDDDNQQIEKRIQQYSLEDFIQFANRVPITELFFLEQGIQMNLEIAKDGLKNKSEVAAAYDNLIKQGLMENNPVSRAQILCSAASEARMSGSKLPVMSTAGSGNHGITAFLTNYAVAEIQKLPKDLLLRSLALTHLITLFIKSYTGILSAMCGCGVAAGIGASAGVVYLLSGNKDQIMGAIYNMIGSISGIICDGAKEGCALKLALSAGWAVQSALLSINGAVVRDKDGIVKYSFKQIIENLGYICKPGMDFTDKAIIDIMTKH